MLPDIRLRSVVWFTVYKNRLFQNGLFLSKHFEMKSQNDSDRCLFIKILHAFCDEFVVHPSRRWIGVWHRVTSRSLKYHAHTLYQYYSFSIVNSQYIHYIYLYFVIYYKKHKQWQFIRKLSKIVELNVNLDDTYARKAAEQETVIFIDMYFGSSFLCFNVSY